MVIKLGTEIKFNEQKSIKISEIPKSLNVALHLCFNPFNFEFCLKSPEILIIESLTGDLFKDIENEAFPIPPSLFACEYVKLFMTTNLLLGINLLLFVNKNEEFLSKFEM